MNLTGLISGRAANLINPECSMMKGKLCGLKSINAPLTASPLITDRCFLLFKYRKHFSLWHFLDGEGSLCTG